MLAGKAAGVQITNDNGVAGASTSIRIRGVNTLSGGAEPLYVIDGIPLMNDDISESSSRNGYNISPLSLINPNDIENITILKDASATAIYGSRGANGVILITTKSGSSGKPKLKLDVSSGVSSETNRITMLNSQQYVELYQQAWENDGHDPSDLTEINNINLDSISNTDWIDEVLQVGQFVNANLSLNGGKDNFNYYLGSSYRNETTFLKGNEFERATFKGSTTVPVHRSDRLIAGSDRSIGSISFQIFGHHSRELEIYLASKFQLCTTLGGHKYTKKPQRKISDV